MYRNQYLIINKKLAASSELKENRFNHFYIYSHPSVNITSAKKISEILLIGYIINPLKPQDSNEDIIRSIAESCETKESLFRQVQKLSGRFILLYKNNSDFIAINDACALRQLYYGFINKDIVLTSSPKMFLDFYGRELLMSDFKKDLIKLNEFKSNEHWWLGDKCIDDRLRKVLPNHFLAIADKKVYRIPIYYENFLTESDLLEYSARILEGSFDAITRRYQIIQPLTAGWDSRTLLAASRKYKDSIQYYVFDYKNGNNKIHSDVLVSQNLSAKLGLNYQIIQPEELKDDFLIKYQGEQLLPRIQYNTAEIQYHFYNSSDRNIVRVSGIGEEIVRCFYGYTKNSNVDANMLDYFSGYLGKSKYITEEINLWLREAKEYSQEYAIPILDLFYWEQRVGNLGALFLFEQDIAIEDFCPICNKDLLINILRVNPKKRSSPKYTYISDLIKRLWADALTEPINPCGYLKYLKRLIKRNSLLRYYYYTLGVKSTVNPS